MNDRTCSGLQLPNEAMNPLPLALGAGFDGASLGVAVLGGNVGRISDEHFKAIGGVAVAHGTLEWLIDNLLVALVGSDHDVGEIVSARAGSVHRQVELIEDLLGYRFRRERPDVIDLWQKVRKEIKSAQEERNALLHSAWLLEDESKPEELTRMSKKGGVTKLTPEEISEIAQHIEKTNKALIEVVVAVGWEGGC